VLSSSPCTGLPLRSTSAKRPKPRASGSRRRPFTSTRPCRSVLSSDITYIDTMEGWLYLAVVLDLRSRRVVGWSMSQSLETPIVLDALRMALSRRQPGKGVLHHSDRGSQYADKLFRQLLKDHGMKCSMSRKGDCWDNAVVESFNATIKTELIHRTKWITREEVRAAVYKWIETWYNPKRLHSTLGYRSPDDFESDEKQPAA
jgi:putative transposase